jgi:hypothetical protein
MVSFWTAVLEDAYMNISLICPTHYQHKELGKTRTQPRRKLKHIFHAQN